MKCYLHLLFCLPFVLRRSEIIICPRLWKPYAQDTRSGVPHVAAKGRSGPFRKKAYMHIHPQKKLQVTGWKGCLAQLHAVTECFVVQCHLKGMGNPQRRGKICNVWHSNTRKAQELERTSFHCAGRHNVDTEEDWIILKTKIHKSFNIQGLIRLKRHHFCLSLCFLQLLNKGQCFSHTSYVSVSFCSLQGWQ